MLCCLVSTERIGDNLVPALAPLDSPATSKESTKLEHNYHLHYSIFLQLHAFFFLFYLQDSRVWLHQSSQIRKLVVVTTYKKQISQISTNLIISISFDHSSKKNQKQVNIYLWSLAPGIKCLSQVCFFKSFRFLSWNLFITFVLNIQIKNSLFLQQIWYIIPPSLKDLQSAPGSPLKKKKKNFDDQS